MTKSTAFRALALLERLQYETPSMGGAPICVGCRRWLVEGHTALCEVQNTIQKLKDEITDEQQS